jgi:hypothetical protein
MSVVISTIVFSLYLSIISFVLAAASKKSLLRLWIVAGFLAAAASVEGLTIDSLPLYSMYCGPLCGYGVFVYLSAISAAIIAGATVYSIPKLRQRPRLRIILASALIGLVMIAGIGTWIS